MYKWDSGNTTMVSGCCLQPVKWQGMSIICTACNNVFTTARRKGETNVKREKFPKKVRLTLRDGFCAHEDCQHRGIVHRTVAGCYKCIEHVHSTELAIA